MKSLFLSTILVLVYPFYQPANESGASNPPVEMHSKNHAPVGIRIYSNELLNQSGNLSVQVSLHADDTTYIHADSLFFVDTSVFSLGISGLSGGQTLYPNDSISFTITGTYNTGSLPYSYTSNSFVFKVLGTDSTESFAKAGFKVYFTPYGTTEIWNAEDFAGLPREWIVFQDTPPARVSIHPDSIPVSDRNEVDSSSEDWEYDYRLAWYPGLPYAVEMAAVHPDSAYLINEGDTFETTSSIERFTGQVSGQLSINMLNDNNQFFVLHPAGVHIVLKDRDKTVDDKLAEGYTDANGFFTLNYDEWQTGEQDNLELYLKVISEDNKDEYDIEVRRTVAGPYTPIIDLGQFGQNITENVGEVFLDGDAGFPIRTLHYARNVFVFCENELGDNILSPGLDIKLNADRSYYLPEPTKTVRLEELDDRHESVVYHEMGHFVMGELQGGFPNPPCLLLQHSNWIEISYTPAWTEGWANGFAAILDLALSEEDGEYGRDAIFEGGVRANGNNAWFEMESRESGVLNLTDEDFPAGNGFRSEYHIATALYDLFDGPANFPTAPGSDEEWNDETGEDAYSVGSDNACLSFYDIVEPMRNTGGTINSVADYFERLVLHLRSKDNNWCTNIVDIRHVFQENRVSFDISNDNYIETSLTTNYYPLGSVYTFSNQFFRQDVLLETCPLLPEFFKLQLRAINGAGESFNFNANYASEEVWLNDPLTIENGATLWCNDARESGWSGSGSPEPFVGSVLDLIVCNKETIIEDGGILSVGNSDEINFSNLIINPYTSLIIKDGGKLIVNQGSSVVIENYAHLIFEDGAEIELVGSNSILEIKGRLSLGANADFATIGLGLVRFNMLEYPGSSQYNILTTGNNCKVTFSGKNVEVIQGTYVYPMDNLAMFTLYSSTVRMGADAFLNIGCPITMELSTLRKIASFTETHVHDGIKLYGQHVPTEGRVVIKDCIIRDARYGVRAYQGAGGNSTKITGCEFTLCDYAVMLYDRGAYLFGNTFTDNYHTIMTYYTTNYVNVESNWIGSSLNYGLSGIAQPGSKFIVAGNVFKGNYIATYYNRATAYHRCNAIYGNFMFAMTDNLGFYRSNQTTFARLWFEQGGDNLYEESSAPGGVNWSQFYGNSRYLFINGYNEFSRTNNNDDAFTITSAVIRPNNQPFPPDIRFDNNYWTPGMALSNPNVVNFLSLNPSTGHNPHFWISLKNTTLKPIFTYGAALTSVPGCPITEWAAAIDDKDLFTPGGDAGMLFKKRGDEGLLGQQLLQNPSRPVSSGYYNGQTAEVALKTALNAVYLGQDYDKDSVNVGQLLNLGNLVLTLTNSTTDLIDDDYMYDEYMSALNSAISDGLITPFNQSTYVSLTEDIIEDKIDAVSEMEFTYPEAHYAYLFTYSLDKAYMYRSFGLYTEAMSELSDISTFADEKDQPLVDGFSCYVTKQKQLKDSLINLFQFGEDVTGCSEAFDSLYMALIEPIDSLPIDTNGGDMVSYTLTPNPTSMMLNMSLDLDDDAYIEVRIYTKQGLLMLSDPLGNKLAGMHYKSYNVGLYDTDVYIFIVFANGVPHSQNFVVY